jgi:hypothetical protein
MNQIRETQDLPDRRDPAGETGSAHGEIVVATLMIAFIGWYFLDAASRSTRVENLILIVPMSIAAAVVSAVLLLTIVVRLRQAARAGAPSARAIEPVDHRITAVAGLLCLYLLLMEPLGLDAATAVFLCACFAVLGVRGWLGLVVAPIVVAFGIVLGMKAAFFIHIPTLFEGRF